MDTNSTVGGVRELKFEYACYILYTVVSSPPPFFAVPVILYAGCGPRSTAGTYPSHKSLTNLCLCSQQRGQSAQK